MTTATAQAARIALEALTGWERNFLRLRKTGDFGMLRRELGDMKGRPEPDKHYGPVSYEDDAERIHAAIEAKVAAALARQSAREEATVTAQEMDHVRPWLSDEGRFTKAEFGAAFGFSNSTVHRLFNEFAAAGEIRETERRQKAAGGGRPAVVWEYVQVEAEADDRENPPEDPAVIPAVIPAEIQPDADAEPHTPASVLGAAGEVVPHDGEPPSIAEQIAYREDNGLTIPRRETQPRDADADPGPAPALLEGDDDQDDDDEDDLLAPMSLVREWIDAVSELQGNVRTLDECRQQFSRSVAEAHEAIEGVRGDVAQLREDLTAARLDVAAGASAIDQLGDNVSRAVNAASTDRQLAATIMERLEATDSRLEDVEATLNAETFDALDVTLGAAVAGLARIGRGELAPERLREELER